MLMTVAVLMMSSFAVLFFLGLKNTIFVQFYQTSDLNVELRMKSLDSSN